MRIKTGDIVEVISGDDKGKQGKVLNLNPKTQRVLIEGVNFIKRHSKPSQQNQQGGIVEREASLHVSSVMLVVSGSKTKVGYRFLDNGKKIRFSKKTNEDIDS
jgi:large subunit ribosomal protein L24